MVAYISRLNLPDPAANAIQTLQMAAALSRRAGGGGLFIHDSSSGAAALREQYGLQDSPLRFWSLGARRWPLGLYHRGPARFILYNSGVALLLGLHPAWRRIPPADQVLFVRSRLEILYWGRMRPYLRWLRDWLLVCELHDLPGSVGDLADRPVDGSRRRERMLRALEQYDLILAVTRELAEDVEGLSGGRLQVHPEPLCSGLPRLERPPAPPDLEPPIVLGYAGTIDRAHGIEDLLEALHRLPQGYRLRLVGRVREDARPLVEQAARTGRLEWVPPLPYAQMAAEIDRYHIALAPAGSSRHATHYRSPLKVFDYLARGRPLVAADVPAHRELLEEGVTAAFYRRGDPAHLAAQIQASASRPEARAAMACAAWKASREHTYDSRADRLWRLFERARLEKQRRPDLGTVK